MRIVLGLLLLGLAAGVRSADLWQFENRLAIGELPTEGVFHHLDGAGRKHLAVSETHVAAVWEDNHSGKPQVYVAYRSENQPEFSSPALVSTGNEAYEPTITSLGEGRFALAWEQDGLIYTRQLNNGVLLNPARLSASAQSHVSLASMGRQAFAAWRERVNGKWYLLVAELRETSDGELTTKRVTTVEPDGLDTPVQFPSISVNTAGLCVAWEDRRSGHTRLLLSYSPNAETPFGPVQNLNEFFSERNEYDKGSGVTRVTTASFGEDEIVAAWMDKRRGGVGYGIFAALGAEGGDIFGPNEKVHGEQGDKQPHYNPATAGNPAGDFVVAWDDFRNGDSDIWLSNYTDDLEWSEDFSPAVASGAGEQSHPSIALDADGGLHLLWIERSDPNAPSRLWYSYGRPK